MNTRTVLEVLGTVADRIDLDECRRLARRALEPSVRARLQRGETVEIRHGVRILSCREGTSGMTVRIHRPRQEPTT